MKPHLRLLVHIQRYRAWLIAALCILVAAEILFFSPTSVDTAGSQTAPAELDPKELAANFEDDNRALGFEPDRIPEYSVIDFDYTSSQRGRKEWKLNAHKAYMYNQERLVLARETKAQIFDPDGKITTITGEFARYKMTAKDLEVFGHVKTHFQDGFEVESDYVHYFPNTRTIEVPKKYRAKGDGIMEDEKHVHFISNGLEFSMASNQVLLPENVTFIIEPESNKKEHEITTVESDRCAIDRVNKVAQFSMYDTRPNDEDFVQLRQPTLYIKSRLMELNYSGDTSVNSVAEASPTAPKKKKQSIQYLIAKQDVFMQEFSHAEVKRYGTSGHAVFETEKNIVIMTEFPQLYQDNDTVTGEKITLHRDTDIVEVENSNAFNQGDSTKK